jgi:hypothetical protein
VIKIIVQFFLLISLCGCEEYIGNIGDIVRANSMKEVDHKIRMFAKNWIGDSVIIFDVDYTLTAPTITVYGVPVPITSEDLYTMRERLEKQGMPRIEVDKIAAATLFLPQTLTDKDAVSVVNGLNCIDGAKVFAMTATLSSDSIVKIRDNTLLNKFGFDFSRSSSATKIVFENFQEKYGHKPLFLQGIAYTNEESKGKILRALVAAKLIKKKPSYVVIVDDRINNIRDVQKSVREIWEDTECLGILYSAPDNATRISQEKLTAILMETKKLHENDF